MNYKLKAFGAEARRLRLAANLKQSDVRGMVGINEDTLRRTEKGLTLPNIETLDLLSLAYGRDMNSIFSQYKITFDQYFEDRISSLLPSIRKLDFKAIEDEMIQFTHEFEKSKRINSSIITLKMNQYREYLRSLSNFENAFSDKSRDDITRLIGVTNYSLTDVKRKFDSLLLDKLEIRIFVLLSVIYRFKNEFDNSIVFLKASLSALEKRYSQDHDFLYFYFLIVTNLLTIYHRVDDFDSLDIQYKSGLSVIEEKIGVPTVVAFLLRSGINKHFLNEEGGASFVDVALRLLKDAGYDEKSERFRKSLKDKYTFLDEL
jgi:transcriptional regulator with XRE-family HTH domain